ncbi:MAG: hypothetical protein AB7U85_03430 [Alphaproteobacteria bacterium]
MKRNVLRILAIVMLGISVSACGIGCLTRTASDVDEEVRANCFSCSLFSITYTAASKLAAKVYENILPGAANFLAWGFVIWLVVEIAKFVGSVKAPNSGDFWKKVLFKFLICMVCIIIVKSSENVIWFVNTIINPIFMGFVDFASNTMGSTTCNLASENVDVTSSALMPTEPRVVLECLIGEIHEKLSFGKSLGRALICHPDSTISMVIVGFLFVISFSAISVVFPFYIVDCIIRLGISLSLLPLFIMSFPFESTRKFTNKGFVLFLDAGMTMAVVSISITLVTGVIRTFVSQQYPFILDSNIESVDDFAGAGTGTITLLFLMMLVFSSVSIASSIAQGLVGSNVPNGVVATMMKAIKTGVKIATTAAAIAVSVTGVGAGVGLAIKGASTAAEGATDTAADVAGDGNGN